MKSLTTISRIEVLQRRKEIVRNPLPFHHKNFQKYGDTFRVDLGRKNRWVFTKNAKTIKYILQKNHKNYGKSVLQTKDLAKYVGYGLLTTNGGFWLKHRRMIQPAFHKKKLANLVHIMQRAIGTELKLIKENEFQDVYPLMGDLAFQVVAQSLFSADDLHIKMRRLKEITNANQQMLIKEMRLPYLKWWFRLNGEINKHLKLTEEARALLNDIIQKRIDLGQEKDDLLDMLLGARYEDGTPMARRQLIDEVLILFVAGHETTANALSFTLYLLAKHPEIQDKLYDELRAVSLDVEDKMQLLGQLSYVQQCIQEAMRLYPPVYFIDRESIAKDEIDNCTFDKGTVWLINLYELHRDPEFWRQPESFLPERFDASNKKDFSDYYFPFGAGPRMCVGNNFSMYEMIFTVAEIMKKYRLITEKESIEINPLITLRPEEVIIKFVSRI
ncbi:MAG: cytochrome P450 [Flavobacteriaceae bacterium]|nr:MAG: cytochrome P450 [Flavobacteriaceae bacterium]